MSRSSLTLVFTFMVALAGCLTPGPLLAQFCGDVADYNTNCDRSKKSYYEEAWREQETVLPPLPEQKNLRAIDANRADPRYDYLLDKASINRGVDDVMRYTVVVESSTGVRNVFHEGIRCLTDEVKTFAYASGDREFKRTTGSRWQRIAVNGVRAYQEYLASVILCDANGYAWDTDKAIAALSAQYTDGGVRVTRSCRDCERMDDRRHD